MDRVGGYLDLLALEADASRYDDLLIVIRAEGEARRLRKMEAGRG